MRESITETFGEEVFRLCRKYESNCIKLAEVKNHCIFNLRCKKSGLIPRGLCVVPPMKTKRGFEIAERERAGHAFVKEEL